MREAKKLLQDTVPAAWIDYNGHMNDAEYSRAFSQGVDAFMTLIGLTEDFRDQEQYTVYTLEAHICYLDEMKQDEPFDVRLQILDYDAKRAHVFFELFGDNDKRAATGEQMLMGMDQTTGRPAPFPETVFTKLEELAEEHTPAEKPQEAGRVIGIRHKK
ncbi:thioesterase family protein [Barrientosiimonas marina]|uniref:Thioesterase family protein n=1 Tax=Lentibacillus kimchii TaxID=1542911 RepID=A0ABW2UTL6_9BACI